MDSYMCLVHLTTGLVVDDLFGAFAGTAFMEARGAHARRPFHTLLAAAPPASSAAGRALRTLSSLCAPPLRPPQFVLFSFFEMKFMVLIWKARRPEQFNQGRAAAETPRSRPPMPCLRIAAALRGTAQVAALTSLALTAVAPSRPRSPHRRNWRREMGVLHSYFYVALLGGVFLVYQLSDFAELVVLAFFSFWLWQVAHNVQHDVPRPLLPKYVVGTSVARLLLPLYVFGCPKNFIRSGPARLRHSLPPQAVASYVFVVWASRRHFASGLLTPDAAGAAPPTRRPCEQEYGFCAVLVLWVGFQVAVLYSQSRWGARWFVPRRWRPQKYDYHREARAGNRPQWLCCGPRLPPRRQPTCLSACSRLGPTPTAPARLQVPQSVLDGLGHGDEEEGEAGGIDCVVCMAPVDVHRLDARMVRLDGALCLGALAATCPCRYESSLDASRALADAESARHLQVTPCDHFFHNACMLRWMQVKLECPTCRRPLPTP